MKKIYTLILSIFITVISWGQCNHTLKMIDSYGDGWNGATVDLTVNGTTVLSAVSVPAGGSIENASFTASTGDALSLANWVSGSYDSEISWEILDGSGTIISSGVWGDVAGGAGLCGGTNPCANAVATPFDEGFESGSLASCWALSGGENWQIRNSGPNHVGNGGTLTGTTTTGNYYAVVDASGYSGDSTTLTTPLIDVSTLTAAELTFFLISDEEGTGYNSTLTVTCNTDTVGSYTGNTSGWEQKIINLSSYTGTVQVAFVFSEPSASGAYWDDIAIDDVSVHEAPNCPAPTALTTANITDVSADLSWTAGGTETAWNVEYGAAGFTPGSGTVVPLTAASYSATGLTASTSYDMYVQADCGGSLSAWVGPASITTLISPGTCGTFTAEVFDSYGDGWNGNGLVVSINGTITDTLATTSADGTNAVTTLIPVDIGDVVDFTYVVDAYGTGSANTWVGENSYNVYDHAGIVIAAAATGSDPATGGPVSSLGLTACPSCTAPNTLTASNITNSSADLGWVAGGSETAWNIEYGASGFAQGSGTTVAVTTNPYSLTGLTAATSYDYYIQSDCGGGDTSIYAGPYTFGTTCNADVAPYFEDFDAGLSVCWTNPGTPQFGWTLDAGGTPSSTTGPSDDMTGGGNYMYIETSSPRAPGDSAFLITSNIDMSGLSSPELRFFSHMYGASIGELSIHIVTAANPTPTMIWQTLGDQGNQWDERTVDLSAYAGGTVQFIVLGVVGDNGSGTQYWGDAAIDNFQVRDLPSNDLSVVAGAVPSGCDLTATETLEIWVVNAGIVAETGFSVEYSVNGGTAVSETITSSLNPGDTLMHMFTATADMSADGMYVVDFSAVLSTDFDTTNNHLSGVMGENYITPAAPNTNSDTICNGDTAMVTSDAGYTSWYDAATGGNLVGEGAAIDVMPTTTTSYYAEAVHSTGHSENFDSYNSGDFIVAADPNNWAVWPGGTPGGAYDMQVTDVQGNGGNSLRVFNSDGTDIVLEFGEEISTGKFYYSMDMFIVGEGYINFQEDTVIGTAWNMSITMVAGVLNIDVDGASVLTGSYNGSNPAGNTVWNNFKFDCDYSTGTWEVFADGISQGTFVNPDPVASVNVYPGAGVEYYLDNVEWGKLGCSSTTRTEAVVTVEDCSSIGELSFKDLNIYPNPNNGLFTIANSQEMTDVIITDLQGKIVYNSSNINLNKVNVELNNLERGMYMINIKTNDGMITQTIIVQ